MNNENKNWLDEILNMKETEEEIKPDETAVSSAGLTHPEDLEFERIIQETMSDGWEKQSSQKDATVDPDATQFFAPQQETPVRQRQKKSQAKQDATDFQKGPPEKKTLYNLFGLPHILATVIWALLILFIGVSLGKTVWFCAADLLALGKTGQEVTITIEDGDSLDDVAHKLEVSGMIRYASLFKTFANITGKGDGIHAGAVTFNATTVYDYNALINAMSYDDRPTDTVEVTIPEGYTCAQIFKLLEEKGVCSAKDLEEHAANGELGDYWFLENVKRGSRYCLEGFLFPDTYEFYIGDEAGRVIGKFLDDFDYRFSDRLKDKYEALKKKLKIDLSLYDVIIMASMVQKEKATDPEGYKIASVFYNRMTHAASFPFLNCDSTILYAVDAFGLVTDSEINASPYNTYTQKGLPAGPISNPGLSSLDAALEPEDSKYYYFVLDKEKNTHVFAKTYSEHQKNLKELGY